MRHHRRRENSFVCLRLTTSTCCALLFQNFSLSFLSAHAPGIRSSPTNSNTDSFSPPFFIPPETSLFWEKSIAITLSGTQKVVPTPMGRKYSIGSSLLTSFLSITQTYLLFSVASLAVATPLISSLLLPLSPSLALGRVLQDLGFDHLPIILTVPLSLLFCHNELDPSFNFQKARWNDFLL